MPDHVELFVSVPPKWSPADIAKILKGRSARWLLKDFPQLKANGHLWTNAYYAGTAGVVSASIIERYIASQRSKQVV